MTPQQIIDSLRGFINTTDLSTLHRIKSLFGHHKSQFDFFRLLPDRTRSVQTPEVARGDCRELLTDTKTSKVVGLLSGARFRTGGPHQPVVARVRSPRLQEGHIALKGIYVTKAGRFVAQMKRMAETCTNTLGCFRHVQPQRSLVMRGRAGKTCICR